MPSYLGGTIFLMIEKNLFYLVFNAHDIPRSGKIGIEHLLGFFAGIGLVS